MVVYSRAVADAECGDVKVTKLAFYLAALVFAITLYLIANGMFVAPQPVVTSWSWEGCWMTAVSPRRVICAV